MTCSHCHAQLPDDAAFCDNCGAKVLTEEEWGPLVGRALLGQYILRRKLGSGGHGVVYEADQPSVARKAAVKVLHRSLAGRAEFIARFRREGLAVSRLEHPSAIKIYNLGETEDGLVWMAMELLKGETLTARLARQGPMSPREVVEIFGPLCEVLSEAHEKGIIHRDIKPDNIMLVPTRSGTFSKLLDFGLADLIDDVQLTRPGLLCGTPAYMSPEHWRGLRYVDGRSDI
jgi:eukaryotic-like serine/threonine-protein kinase